MTRLVQQGMSIIMISSDLPEVLGMSDRITSFPPAESPASCGGRSDSREDHESGNILLRRPQMSSSGNAPQADQVQTAAAPEASFGASLGKMLRANIRDYGMYIALVVIMVFFTITTNGLFISSRISPTC